MLNITVRHKLGHTTEHSYEKSEFFCPACGEHGVWEEHGEGDYYYGQMFICVKCEVNFTIQGPYLVSDSYEAGKKILEAIKHEMGTTA
jgi:hypothetical protein